MLRVITFTLFLSLLCFQLQEANGQGPDNNKSLIGIIIDAAKKQIENVMRIADTTIEFALQKLKNIKHEILRLAEVEIKTTTDAIIVIIDNAFNTIQEIAEDAIDSGINITECYVDNVDKLNIIRRQLLIEEIECATSQMGEFNKIIDGAVKNFTQDLEIIGILPGRLQNCLTSLNVISCVTELVTDVANLQMEIPQQVLNIMTEISNYMIYFEQRLHKCQFDELRKTNDKSRKVIDEVKFCVQQANTTTTENIFL